MADQKIACDKSPQLGLIVPTLHEAGNIREVLNRIRASLNPLNISYEITVVDDDSRDGTAEIVKQLAAADCRLRFLCREGQRGLGSAVRAGWRLSEADVLGVIDADLQHPPELLPDLWQAVREGNDVALASRYVEAGKIREWHPLRHALSRVAILLSQRLQKPGIRVSDPMSGFFLLRRSCLRDVTLRTDGFKLLLEILVRGQVRSVAEVPFTFGPRQTGSSKAGLYEGVDYLRLLARLSVHRGGEFAPRDPA